MKGESKLAMVQTPELNRVLHEAGDGRAARIVGEAFDLVAAGLLDAFDGLKLSPIAKSLAKGPIDEALSAGRRSVIGWAQRALPKLDSARSSR